MNLEKPRNSKKVETKWCRGWEEKWVFNMNKYIAAQKKLIAGCEEPHYIGLRHKGISGAICEKILIRELRRVVPNARFNSGVVKLSNPTSKGGLIKNGDLSSQIDIIVYRKRPLGKICDYAIVDIKNVLAVVEIKKWTHRKMFDRASGFIRSSKKLGKILTRQAKRKIPLFLVSFRFYDGKKQPLDWSKTSKLFPGRNKYCFFGSYSKEKGEKGKKGTSLYPREEKHFQDWKHAYSNEFKKLALALQRLCRGHYKD